MNNLFLALISVVLVVYSCQGNSSGNGRKTIINESSGISVSTTKSCKKTHIPKGIREILSDEEYKLICLINEKHGVEFLTPQQGVNMAFKPIAKYSDISKYLDLKVTKTNTTISEKDKSIKKRMVDSIAIKRLKTGGVEGGNAVNNS